MNHLPWTLAVLATAEFFVIYTLNILNMNMSLKNRETVPEILRDYIDQETCIKSGKYTRAKSHASLVQQLIMTAVIILILLTAIPGFIHSRIAVLDLPGPLTGIIYFMILGTGSGIIAFPFSLYRTFVIEEQFGFNKMTPGLYLLDTVKQGILSLILLSFLFSALYFLEKFGGTFWWLYAWIFYTLFQFLILLVYPVVIAPLFNKFSPLEEGSHKKAVLDVADKSGFRNKGIFVMDGSKRSGHGNAYFTGFGKARRIVFFDTLLKEITPEETAAVLAHEIGHYRKGHIVRRLAVQILTTLILFGAFGFLLKKPELFTAFGFSLPSLEALITISVFILSPLSMITTPFSNLISRKHEYQADNYAKTLTGTGEHLSSALKKLGRNNLSQINPHPLYSGYYYSHPVLLERLKNLS